MGDQLRPKHSVDLTLALDLAWRGVVRADEVIE
jgi:hypothetical protein